MLGVHCFGFNHPKGSDRPPGDPLPYRAVAVEKLQARDSLVQVYCGLIYRGTDFVAECAAVIKLSAAT